MLPRVAAGSCWLSWRPHSAINARLGLRRLARERGATAAVLEVGGHWLGQGGTQR